MRTLLWLGALGLAGCSLVRAPLVEPGRDGAMDMPDVDVSVDAPPLLDVPVDVPGLDAGFDAGFDGGDRLDAPAMPDTRECADGETRCDAEVLATCTGGSFTFDDCASRGAYCEAGACVAQVCVPGTSTCSGAIENRCNPRGSGEIATSRSRGCTDGVGCTPPTACAGAIAGTVSPGSMMTVNTCGQGNDSIHETGCTRTDRTGADVVLRLEIATSGDYRIDVLVTGSVDSVLYVRTACATRGSELDCNDDGAGGYSSRLDLALDAGDYFLIVDSFRDTEGADGRCGEMNVVVTAL